MAADSHHRVSLTGGSRWWTAVIGCCTVIVGLGLADYARFCEQRRTVFAAAWVGARSGAGAPVESDRLDAARIAALSVLGEDGLSDPAHVAASVWKRGDAEYVTVDVRVPYRGLVGFLPTPDAAHARSTWPIGDGVAMLE